LAGLIPWLAVICPAQPLEAATSFLAPVDSKLPGQLECAGPYLLGDDGQVRHWETGAIVKVAPGAEHLAITNSSELVLTYPQLNEVRVYDVQGKLLHKWPCPAPGAVTVLDADIVAVSGNALRIFSPGRESQLPVGRWPVDVLAGDFDQDGRADLAVACPGEGQVRVFTNLGELQFRAETPILSPYPVALACGDLDGDGKNELVSSDRSRGIVSVHGSRRLDLDLKQAVGDVVVADINQDTRPDLLVVAPAVGVFYLLNQGELRFAEPQLLPAGTTSFVAAVGSSVLAGGSFGAQLFPQEAAPLRGELTEFADTLMALEVGYVLAGQQILQGLTLRPVSSVLRGRFPALRGDLDGDGRFDLIFPGEPWVLHRNLGAGQFGPAQTLPYSSSHGVVADFDGNARDELVIFLDNRALQLRDDAAHTLKASIPIGGDTVWEEMACDFDADGRLDVLFSTSLRSNYFLLRNLPTGLGPPVPIAAPSYYWSGTLDAVADLNGDKLPELVYFDQGEITVLANETRGTALRLGKPLEVNMTDESISTKKSGSHGDEGMVLDVNQDGRLDLVDLDYYRDRVAIRLNAGSNKQFRWGDLRTFTTGQGPRRVVAQDLNGDGLPDLVISNEDSKDLSVWINHTHPGSSIPDFGR